jgi:pantetheine-phosphate adenylyltransferase
MTIALFPGSFDPVHNGHLSVMATAAPLFDRLIIGVGYNPEKNSGLFSPEDRVQMVTEAVDVYPNVSVETFTGLVGAAAQRFGADCLIKGIRGATDLDSEMQQAFMNFTSGSVPTLFVPATGAAALVAGRYVREVAAMGGNVHDVVPNTVAARLRDMRS